MSIIHYKRGDIAFFGVSIWGATIVVPFFGEPIKGLVKINSRYEDLLSIDVADSRICYTRIPDVASVATSWEDACRILQEEVPMTSKIAKKLIRSSWPGWASKLDELEREMRGKKPSIWNNLFKFTLPLTE